MKGFWVSISVFFLRVNTLACSFVLWRKFKPTLPGLPAVLCFPAAYLATLTVLSFVVLLMGVLQLLDQYSDFVHLPFWGYVLFFGGCLSNTWVCNRQETV